MFAIRCHCDAFLFVEAGSLQRNLREAGRQAIEANPIARQAGVPVYVVNVRGTTAVKCPHCKQPHPLPDRLRDREVGSDNGYSFQQSIRWDDC